MCMLFYADIDYINPENEAGSLVAFLIVLGLKA
jgi:hypothetical protein